LGLFLIVSGIVLAALLVISGGIGHANGSTGHISLVGSDQNSQFSINSGNIVAVYHMNDLTQVDNSDFGATFGYSPLRDVSGGINIDSSSNSQPPIPDTDHSNKNDGKRNNDNGIINKNGDIPFTLPFP
jgi:hypothetical protein